MADDSKEPQAPTPQKANKVLGEGVYKIAIKTGFQSCDPMVEMPTLRGDSKNNPFENCLRQLRLEHYTFQLKAWKFRDSAMPDLKEYGAEKLKAAAQFYLACTGPDEPVPSGWPLDPYLWAPSTANINLAKASALLVAAMDDGDLSPLALVSRKVASDGR